MKKTEINKLKIKSIEDLELMRKNLKLQLITAQAKVKGLGMHPPLQSPTKLVRDIKRQIARINTILNQKTQIKTSIERCKDKPHSKRRERRLRGKMKELKCL